MPLDDGQSELDTVTVSLTGLGIEIKTWESYSIREDFMTPSAAFDFTFSTNDPTTYNAALAEGAEITIDINGKTQMTGIIDKVRKEHSRDRGMVYHISGRDFLGPVVSASLDPKIRITSGQSVSDFLSAILIQFGSFGSKIYVGDDSNYNIVTGLSKGKSIPQARTREVKEAVARENAAEQRTEVVYVNKTITEFIAGNRPDLKAIPLDQLKPKLGDGAMQVIERILSRLGLRMWMAADGSGVIVDAPNFTRAPAHSLIRRRSDELVNNVLRGGSETNGDQPSCVLAIGQSTGQDMEKIKLKCIAVNELTAVYNNKRLKQSVSDLIARYPGVKVLPLRDALIPDDDRIVGRRKPQIMIVRDDESKTQAQLEAFTRRKLSEKQKEYFSATYEVKGHTYNEVPWAMNTLVDVDDDYLGIHERLWVIDRTFSKSRGEGGRTELRLIKPFTLELGT